ncbi:class I SAM-dependent DNA methyltransferase [Candidatus Pelagibacter sp.]|uniref:class I SAM-dependent DNA methyltransferase n=1 Tax=Candidatus Pelagibacter sp. TaxID=2024849 RepID=UPI003D0D5E89
MKKIFSKYAKYYDVLYKNKSYKKEANYIEKIINKYAGKKLRILELGCGSGGHAFELQKKGHSITALDTSKKMIEIANKKNSKNEITFIQKDLKKFTSNKKFDVIILLFHVVNFLKQKNELKILARNSYQNLKKNGIIIFDFIHLNGVISDKPKKKIKIIKNKNLIITRKTKPFFIKYKKLFNVEFEMIINKNNKLIEKFYEIHELRLHTLYEIKKIFKNKFSVINIFKWMKYSKISNKDWFGLYILKRN